MKKLWKKIRDWWFMNCQKKKDCGVEEKHLRESEIRSSLYGNFMTGLLAFTGCMLIIITSNHLANHQRNKDIEEITGIIATYLATATEDEYDEIAQTIRHDLVYSKYGQEIENFMKYIPNTAENCCMEQKGYLERINLVFLNTGEMYGLDIFDQSYTIEEVGKSGEMQLNFGYDEISDARFVIQKDLHHNWGEAELSQGNGIVSSHRMKELFCDECIEKILHTVENEPVDEAVIYDVEEKIFYPIKEENLQIGSYEIQMDYTDGNYRFEIIYTGE